MFLAFDIWGAYSGVGRTAYHAHLGGFAGGFALIVLALVTRALRMDHTEKSLLQVFGLQSITAETHEPAPSDNQTWQWGPQSKETRPAAPAAPQRPPAPGDNIPRPPGQAQAPSPPPKAGTVRMKCVCGKRLRVPRSFSGQQAKCPRCNQIIQIPEL